MDFLYGSAVEWFGALGNGEGSDITQKWSQVTPELAASVTKVVFSQ